MKLKNLLKFYKISKNWEIINGKLSIPDYDLNKLDIRQGNLELSNDYNPNDTTTKGTFIPPMTQDDITKMEAQQSGWQKFYDKVLNNADTK